jgi:hypothetical protein
VPQEPVDLPVGKTLEVQVSVIDETQATDMHEKSMRPLAGLAELARTFPSRGGPSDRAAQHDHYLYGTAKRP